MTIAQQMRLERRRRRELERKRRIREAIQITVFILLAILAFGWAGSMDYQDEVNQLNYWQERGVTIQRW